MQTSKLKVHDQLQRDLVVMLLMVHGETYYTTVLEVMPFDRLYSISDTVHCLVCLQLLKNEYGKFYFCL